MKKPTEPLFTPTHNNPMNRLKKLNDTHFLSDQEVYMLVSDIVEEQYVSNPAEARDRHVIAWFLRNYHYLPFSLISKCLEYRGNSSAAEAVFSLQQSSSVPVSMNHNYIGLIEEYKNVSDTHYGCSRNVFLDRGMDDEMEEALLYGASMACGHEDKHNKVSWYKFTPKNSTLYHMSEIFTMTITEVTEYTASEIISNYEIRKRREIR
jgi:hypothetical protein